MVAGPAKDRSQLSPREAEIVALRGQGLTQVQIAERLGITLGTVKSLCTSIRSRGKAEETRETQ